MVVNNIITTVFNRFVVLAVVMMFFRSHSSSRVWRTACSAYLYPSPMTKRCVRTSSLASHRQQWANGKSSALAATTGGLDVDGYGRKIRRSSRSSSDEESSNTRSRDDNGWENFTPDLDQQETKQPRRIDANDWGDEVGGRWDDFDRPKRTQSLNRGNNRGQTPSRRNTDDSSKASNARIPEDRRSSSRKYDDYRQRSPPSANFPRRSGSAATNLRSRQRDNDRDSDNKINLMALESSGFVHLYGLASVVNALESNKRDFKSRDAVVDSSDDNESVIKPEAQFTPCLFVQEKQSSSQRDRDKAQLAEKVLELSKERAVPVCTVDKGVLNTLSGNRPHQGFVLRCGKYEFEPLTQIPRGDNGVHNSNNKDKNNLWLVLDEVVDPQNLGALIRSAYFLGGANMLVCAKNSAPPSATVSAASAGALESAVIYSTSNLPKTLAQAEQDGFRIIGASADGSENNDIPIYDLQNLPHPKEQPTLLILGSEGRGLRHLVAKSCTEFVRIPSGRNANSGDDQSGGVDSLNVSVTGGILLWYLLQNQQTSTTT